MDQMPEVKPSASEGSTISAPPVPAQSSRLLLWVLSLLIIALVAVVGWLWLTMQQVHQSIQKDVAHMGKTLHVQTQQQENITQQVNQFTLQLQQQKDQFTQLSHQVDQLSQASQASSQHWKIAEIIYLVRLANLQLAVQHSVTNGLFLLKQADTELTILNDPALEAFHQSVAKNIADLQAIPQTDITAINTQLSALRDQVANLSILVAPKPNTSVVPDSAHQQHKKWWQRAWDNVKASLQQLIIVRHQHEDIPALMAPDQQVYLQENIQLLLIQAQWAVLNQQPAIYQQSLKTAQSWIEKYYVQNSATTQAFLKQLQTLLAIDVAPKLPDLAPTLALINQEAA